MKLSDRELAYVCIRIFLGVQFAWHSIGLLIMYMGPHSDMMPDSLHVSYMAIGGITGRIVYTVFYFLELLAGVGLIFGFQTRLAIVLAIMVSFYTASLTQAVILAALLVFRYYNRFCIDMPVAKAGRTDRSIESL